MSSKTDKYSKDSKYQENLKSPFNMFRNLKENPELFGPPSKIYGDDYFDGNISPPNLSNEINFFRFDNKENLATKDKTNEILNSNKSFLENSNFAKEENDKNIFIGKKIKKDKKNEQKEGKKRKLNIIKKSQKSELKKNQDNFIKAVAKAPFILMIFLIQEIGNIKLKSINLRKLIGGVKKNKIVFKLKLYQMLCCDQDRQNKEILDNAKPKDELLYYYFLTRTYRFLFNHYYEGNQFFEVNGEKKLVPSFPTFDKVLEIRNEKYYKDYQKPIKEKLIEEFKKVSKLVYNNFENCETKPQKKKFFTIITPKIEALENKYKSIKFENTFSLLNKYSNFKVNKEPMNLNQMSITNLSLDEISEKNEFSNHKKPKNEIICFEMNEEIMNQHIFGENKIIEDNNNFSFNSNNENLNISSSSVFDKMPIQLNESNYDDIIRNRIFRLND